MPMQDISMRSSKDNAIDEISSVDLAQFESLLTKMLMENQLIGSEFKLDEPAQTADPADRATIEEERNLFQSVRSRQMALLSEIHAALRRIKDGDYGYCEETGEFIGLDRLRANPTCRLSIMAQERKERLFRARH